MFAVNYAGCLALTITGPLIWSSLADAYGRRLIFIIGTVIAFAASIGAAKASSYGGYMAARFFQGLGVSPAATVGLAIINDCFFEYQRGQKIGLWVLAIDMGLLVGPLIGGFIDLVDHYWIQWLTAILFAAILVAVVVGLAQVHPSARAADRRRLSPSAGCCSASLQRSARWRSPSRRCETSCCSPATSR